MIFDIGSQQTGVINNVSGDLRVYGGQHAAPSMSMADVQLLMGKLREHLRHTALPGTGRVAEAQIDAAASELAKPHPDKHAIAGRLTALTRLLTAARALTTAGTGLGRALASLADWLGRHGEPIHDLLNR